jgi:LysM repeat protein
MLSRFFTFFVLLALNPSVNCESGLQIGTALYVAPETKRTLRHLSVASENASTQSPTCTQYTVKSGDTCWDLAKQNGANLAKLIAENPGNNCGPNLQIGDVLCIPQF